MHDKCVFLFGEIIELDYFLSRFSEYFVAEAELEGYKTAFSPEGKSFLQASAGSRASGVISRLPCESAWLLDQWKDVPFLKRSAIKHVLGGEEIELYLYEANCVESAEPETQFDYQKQLSSFESCIKENIYGKCDIHLMIPCSFDSYDNTLPVISDAVSSELIKSVEFANKYEFSGSFFEQIRRSGQGVYRFFPEDPGINECNGSGGIPCNLPGLVYFSVHESTQIGAVGIVMPNVRLDVSVVLQAFCGECIDIEADGRRYRIRDWLAEHNVKICGSSKAVVFAHNPLEQNEIINCLAMETKPIGKIIGKELNFFAGDNIAQYDIASVFASSDCLLEIENEFLADLSDRLAVQAIEIFFVELLLLQVASIGRACDRVFDYLETQGANYSEKSNDILKALSTEMFNVVNFLDFNRFHFPTVRSASHEISNRFGIPGEIEKYNKYREILGQMIELSSEERTEIEEKNMNLLLLILALLSVLPIFESLYQLIAKGEFRGVSYISWFGSFASCFFLYAVFNLYKTIVIRKNLVKKRIKKWKK